jgi:GNAT superfamily N-acetyltransferase
MRFGWFDVIDDIHVSRALLEKVAEIGRKHNLEYMEGPVGFSNLEKAGLLTEGFDRKATMLTLYNHEYYRTHFETLGFKTANEWVENYFTIPEHLPEKVTGFSKIIQKRYKLNIIRFSSKKDMQPFIKPMFDLLVETYSSLESFVPFSQKQIDYYADKYLKILKPEFVNCITDETGKLCSFAITSPSYAAALQKTKGKLFPFGWYHLLQASRKPDTAEYILIGVHPKYQKKGITSMVFCEIFKTFKKYKIKHIETNPQLIENLNVQLLWTDFDPIIHKKRKTYRKSIL